ncbi:hypothetical protein ACLOJK_026557 [Asimina triloba]
MELEILGLERLQVASTQGRDALSSGSIFSGTHAMIIVEYLWSDVHRRREEYERSQHPKVRTSDLQAVIGALGN